MRKRFCFIGLGNPGSQYTNTPHNIGFEWIDAAVEGYGKLNWSNRFESEYMELQIADCELHFLKPQTYMNLSGKALRSWIKKYPQFQSLFVVLDDIDLPLGRLRFRESGGDAGHKGLRSLIECYGGNGIPRLRIGVGRGPDDEASEFVLRKFSPQNQKIKNEILKAAPDHLKALVENNSEQAMNIINAWRSSESEK